jgi:inorganic pyrophosphatase
MPLNLSAGKNIPHDINVIIEIAANSKPIKYEVDKDSGLLMVDRFMATAMHYPCNYGFVPNTLSADGDPVDVLVITPHPIQAGAFIRCRAIGVLHMTDEAGDDAKVLAVPIEKVCAEYAHIKELKDISPLVLKSIVHFFEHYKDLEPNKWVKLKGWGDVKAAHEEIQQSISRYV